MKRFNIGAAVALALVAPAAASSQAPLLVTGSSLPTEIVSYRDLNLASSDGVARLNRRIESAADRLCVDPNPQPLSAVMLDRACRGRRHRLGRAAGQRRDRQFRQGRVRIGVVRKGRAPLMARATGAAA